MKTKLTRRIVASFLAITAVLLFSIFSINAEDAHKKHGDHQTRTRRARGLLLIKCVVQLLVC